MIDNLAQSEAIWQDAVTKYPPHAVVAMISGGDDSLTAYHVAKEIGVPIDYIMHGVTGTGVRETTDFVRQLAKDEGVPYLEADAGDAYEDYVMRKGFFGRGSTAHLYAYHVLKAGPFRSTISHNIRHGKTGRTVLLINGARYSESDNRRQSKPHTINVDPSAPRNVWVNIIHHWTKRDCLEYLGSRNIKRNPVTLLCHRSGECLCGTMQSMEEAEEVAQWFPSWRNWWYELRQRVVAKHGYDWGQDVPAWVQHEKDGQMRLFDFTPMCSTCTRHTELIDMTNQPHNTTT